MRRPFFSPKQLARGVFAILMLWTIAAFPRFSNTAYGVIPGNGTPIAPSTPPQTPIPAPSEPQTTEIIVDDQDPGFSLGGPSAGWHHSGSGDTTYREHAYWTYTTDTWEGSGVNNWATWTVSLPVSGEWEVFAFIPWVYTGRYDTTRARYQIQSADGYYVVERDQNNNTGWVSLGTYRFNAETSYSVRLEDVTPDWYFIHNGRTYRKTIKFDAIKWVLRQTSQPASCGPMDVAFVVDRSTSMEPAIDNVKAELTSILGNIAAVSGGDYRLALVTFADDITILENFAPNNRSSIEQKFRQLNPYGGGMNEPEASDEALNTVINALPAMGRAQNIDFTPPFRTGVLKLIVLVTDARPGGFDDNYSPGIDDVNARQRALEAASKDIKIAAIFAPTPDWPEYHSTARRIMQDYAAITGGVFVETSSDGSGTGTAVNNIIAQCGTGPTKVRFRGTIAEIQRSIDGGEMRVQVEEVLAGPSLGDEVQVSFDNIAGCFGDNEVYAARVGDRVEVYGSYDPSYDVVDTCSSEDYIYLLCVPSRWRGEYYDNQTLSGDPLFARCDDAVDFNWGADSPDPLLPADHFSVRWTGTPNFPVSGRYRFHTLTDDGVRLWVDNQLLIDRWHDQEATEYTAEVELSAGPHEVRMEYYENGGWAQARLWWESLQPTNDDFDYATPMSPQWDYWDDPEWPIQILDTDTTDATVAPDDPDMGCGTGVNSNTLWFRITPSFSGQVVADTFDSDYDTVLAVFTGTRGALNWITCNDDAGGTFQSQVVFDVEGGQTYYLEVADYGSDPGGGVLSIKVRHKLSIAGRVLDDAGNPIPGVTISDNAGHTTTTDDNGRYVLDDLGGATYTITPSKSGYSFSPASRTVTVPPNVTGVDFTGRRTSIQTPIVLLPGLMGSRLSNEPLSMPNCKERPNGEIWPNFLGLVTEVLEEMRKPPRVPQAPQYNKRLRALWLKGDGQTPQNSCDQIQPSGIIAKVEVGIPGIVDKDFYERFVIEMEDSGYDVFIFTYDWRLDVEENARRLDNYIINTVLREASAPKVVLIGHSLGGLVARQYVSDARRAQRISKVITVGTPYWGAPELAKHMRAGTTSLPFDLLLDDSIIWKLIRNSPAAMQILPSEAYFRQYGSTTAYYIDDTRFLDSYQKTLDFFKDKGQNAALIEQARRLHRVIDDFRQNLNVPYYVLTANHRDAVNVIREYPCFLGGTCWDEDSYIPGDGTVPWISARLYGVAGDWSGNAQVCTFSKGAVTKEHGELLSDDNVIEDIKYILQGEPTRHCKFPRATLQIQRSPDPLIQIAVWGEARVSVRDAVGNFTGVTDEGLIVNEIPLASYRKAGAGTFIVLPASTTYTLYISEESHSPIQVRITDFRALSVEEAFSPRQRAIFVDVPAAPGGMVTMQVDPTASLSTLRLAVDLDNDGVSEAVLPPTSILDQEQSQDITRPTTTITVQGTRDPWGFYTGLVTVRLSATDTGTGVLKTEYSLDGGQTWQPYSGPITFVAEEVPVLYARSVDRAGNHEYPWPNRRLRPYTFNLPLLLRGQASRPTGQLELASHIGGVTYAVAVHGNYAYIGEGPQLTVLDVSDPAAPRKVGSVLLPEIVQDIYVVWPYAYVANGPAGLQIVNVSNPANPWRTGFYDTPGDAKAVFVSGGYAYVADGSAGLQVIEVSNPAAPHRAGSYDTPGHAEGIFVADGYAYVGAGSAGLRVIDVSDPRAPREVSVYDTPGYPNDVFVVSNYAYVAEYDYGLRVLDVSNPRLPQEVGFYATPRYSGGASSVFVVGNYAYVIAFYSGLRVVDISNPASPREVGFYDIRNTESVQSITGAGGYVYIAAGDAGLQLVDVSNPAAPQRVGTYETWGKPADVHVAGSYGYLADWYDGLQVVEVSNPAAPRKMGAYGRSEATSVFVAGNYAYVGAGSLQVMSLSNPAVPEVVGIYNRPGVWSVTDVFVLGDYAYVTDYWGGLRVIDISNPTTPREVGFYQTPGNAVGVFVRGEYAYIADGDAGLQIVDVSNPTAPRRVGSFDTSGAVASVFVAGNYAYVADQNDGLRVMDVSNPSAPREIGFDDTPGEALDVIVASGYAYVADGDTGLRVIDVTNPATPREITSYDIPGHAVGVFALGSYAYVVGMDSGLFIFRVR